MSSIKCQLAKKAKPQTSQCVALQEGASRLDSSGSASSLLNIAELRDYVIGLVVTSGSKSQLEEFIC